MIRFVVLLSVLACHEEVPLSASTSDTPDPTTTPSPATSTPATSTPATDTATSSTSGSTAGSPTLSFALVPDTIHVGDPLEIDVTLTNFTLVDPTTYPPVAPNEGHIHVWEDGALLGAFWALSTPLDTSAATVGDHEIELTLEDSQHNELNPPVEATQTLHVE